VSNLKPLIQKNLAVKDGSGGVRKNLRKNVKKNVLHGKGVGKRGQKEEVEDVEKNRVKNKYLVNF